MINKLKEIGLSEYESKVYVALIKYGSQNSKNLSKTSKVPQSKIYSVLYKLNQKNLISILNTKPKQFSAANPKKTLKEYIDSKKANLENNENQIIQKLKNIKKTRIEPQKTDELIRIHCGRKQAMSIVTNRFRTAKKYIKEMFTFEYIPSNFFRETKNAIDRRVKVRMIATKNGPEQIKLIKKFKNMGVDVRYYPVTELRIAIKDGKEAVQMIVNPRDPMDRTSIVIESKELTNALEHYFDHVWNKAEIL